MRSMIATGFLLLSAAIAFGVAQFFGIINANEIIHPRSTARKLTAPTVIPANLPTEAGCSERTPLALVWSMRNETNKWSLETHRIVGPRVSLWISNGPEYLGIEGGLGFPYSQACRALVWATYEDLQKASADELGK